jgi:nitrogen fixation protein NifU and related proteins
MAELDDIYQEVILDHYRKPRNFAAMPEANRQAGGHNPLCGDRVTVFLEIADGIVQKASFQGAGCAISTASASMMTDAVQGMTVEAAEALFRRFHAMLTGDADRGSDEGLGKLEALAGVREIPIRVKCATLAWHTMKAALDNRQPMPSAAPAVSTE